MRNHSKPNLQLKSEYNLKSDNIINVEFFTESETGLFLLITKKFLHIEMLILKKNKPDDKKIDISNLKYVCVLIIYITELKNKIKLVYYINIRISIPKTYQKTINDFIFIKK